MQRSLAAIVPTMDRPDRLRAALESVRDQTHDAVEAVVVDGGDEPAEQVVDELRDDGLAVTYVRNDAPQGLPAARNQGAAATDADVLGFLDDDDRWRPDFAEAHLAALDDGAALSYCGFTSVTPDGDVVHVRRPTRSGDLYEDLLVRNVVGPPSTVAVRRSVFDAVDGFDESLDHQEDWAFYLTVADRDGPAAAVTGDGGPRIAAISEPLTERLHHDDAMSRDVAAQKRGRERILERNDDALRARGLRDAAWSAHHRKAGVTRCLSGDTAGGRREFLASLRHRPRPGVAVLLALALTGPRGFRVAVAVKRRLVTAAAATST